MTESQTYLESISKQQTWRGDEPAFQLLWYPSASTSPLPQYSSVPHFLSPSHCRLCLEHCPEEDMERHLRERHECTMSEYRERVLRAALAEWPQTISPQILRTRLAAFKEELCDANFQQLPCASCARLKRRCKLTEVTFPPADAPEPPAWLPWDLEEWMIHRSVWYTDVDKVFNINNYLDIFFV